MPVIVSCLAILFLLLANPERELQNVNVAHLGDRPISVQSMHYCMRNRQSEVLVRYNTEYGVSGGDGFWNTEFDGRKPIEVLKELALEDCYRLQAEMTFLHGSGFLENDSIDSFHLDLHRTNALRLDADGQAEKRVYGPREYSLPSFIDHSLDQARLNLFSSLRVDTLESVAQYAERLYVTDREVEDYFNRHREDLQYKRFDIIVASVPASSEMTGTERRKLLGGFWRQIQTREFEDGYVGRMNGVDYEMVAVSTEYAAELKAMRDELYSAIIDLKDHSMTRVFEESNLGKVSQAKVLRRTILDTPGLASNTPYIRQLLTEKKYDRFISQTVETARKRVDGDVYGSLSVEGAWQE